MADSENNLDDIFELDRIRRLIDLMKEHGLTEVDLRQGDQQIRLARTEATVASPLALPSVAPATAVPAAAAPVTAPASTPEPSGEVEEDKNITYIKAPMIGTYYSKPNPNADSYVKVGDHVNEDTVVCIIEAMKVFNEIPAEVSGRVIAILVDEEEPLDFDKPLFKIDTSN